jgi:O-antigen/teichoic acid export membrane protein
MLVTVDQIEAASSEQKAEEPQRAKTDKFGAYLVKGTSALGAGLFIERGFGFLANMLAARLGGAATFGAYSLAIATANNIGTYAAGGIGSTATRFSGKYARGASAFQLFTRALLIVSFASATLAATALWLGARPIAALLANPGLTPLLQWAAFSAAGMIVLECCRGFLIGQRRLFALVLLSLLVGAGMVSFLPAASRLGPIPMVASQGLVTISAVLICLSLKRPLGFGAPRTPDQPTSSAGKLSPILKEIWGFTFIQLAGLVGMNAAGWWLTSLVARSDGSMRQIGFYAIANQLRNMVAVAPGLLSQSSLALMANPEAEGEQTPDRVMAICSFVATAASFLLAGSAILIAPWLLALLYGKSYAAASSASILSLATAAVHMGNAPAAGRLTVVSIHESGVINSVWALLVALSASTFLIHPGDAGVAAAIIFMAHLFSAVAVLVALSRHIRVPAGMKPLFMVGASGITALASVCVLREQAPMRSGFLTASASLVFVTGFVAVLAIGKRHGWIPDPRPLAEKTLRRMTFSLQLGGHEL